MNCGQAMPSMLLHSFDELSSSESFELTNFFQPCLVLLWYNYSNDVEATMIISFMITTVAHRLPA